MALRPSYSYLDSIRLVCLWILECGFLDTGTSICTFINTFPLEICSKICYVSDKCRNSVSCFILYVRKIPLIFYTFFNYIQQIKQIFVFLH